MGSKLFGMMLGLSLSTLSYAGFEDDLNKYANDIGYANVTGATAEISQAGGYLSAGSGYIATPVKHAQLGRLQLPDISSSCAGMDWHTGGMSFISAEELAAFGQAIIQGLAPFAIDLALQTMAPQIANLKAKFEGIANFINGQSLNSCQGSQLAVGAIAGAFMEGESKKYLCQTYKTQNNQAADWLAAQQGCSTTKDADKANEDAKGKGKKDNLEDLIKQDRNLVWYQFMKNEFLKESTEIAEYLMSMTGTIIYPPVGESERAEPERKAPLIIDSKTAGFHELLFGSTKETKVEIYNCNTKDQNGCKKPTVGKLTIAEDKALVPKITKILESLGQKFQSDTKLSKAESDLVNAVDFPLSMMLQNEIRAGWYPQYRLYAEIISRIVLSSYLHQIISQASQAIAQNPSATADEDYKWILSNLEKANRFIIAGYQIEAYQALKQRSDMMLRTMQVEHSVVGDLSALTKQKHSFGDL